MSDRAGKRVGCRLGRFRCQYLSFDSYPIRSAVTLTTRPPQTHSRKHLGELEKKKDYKLRARDFQRKRNTLKKLSQKALERNRDEFYFHMINCKTENGKVFEKSKSSKEEHTTEQMKLINTQDERYINFKMNMQRLVRS
ncbi:unnamed protein product [Soboliphyme baturini]|uniref:Probable U3 small nucleolar RNA-associated protein 11 n=1 Tax=Soboliphyme baturini TaxID=241478 RepID=A0A183IEJ4_9BILA|nr:unnamed protein product [Soboliphyme baturini]